LHVSYGFVPERDRAKTTGFLVAGAPLGTALAALLLTPLLLRFGWRSAYAVLALVSFVWAACWLAVASKAPPQSVTPKELRPSWRLLLGNRKMIGAMLASFTCYFANSVALVWYPKFFETGVGIGAGPTGAILAAAWAAQIPVCIFAGWIIARGAEKQSERAALYGRIGIAALGFTSLSLIGLTFTSILPVVVASAVASLLAAATLFIALAPLVAQLAPSGSRATALGAYAAFYALAGAIGPWLFGAMVDLAGSATAGYRLAFTALGGATIVVTLIAALLILPDRRALLARPESARA
jgi:MFS family permease